jgi:hypothetical protein
VNEEANPSSAERDRNSGPAPQSGPPASPWSSPPPASGQQPPFWVAPQPRSAPPAEPVSQPWEAPAQQSGPPFPHSGPPAQQSSPPAQQSVPPAQQSNAQQSSPPAQQSGSPYPSWSEPADTTASLPAPTPPRFGGSGGSNRRGLTGWIAGVAAALLVGGLGGYFIGAAGSGGEQVAAPESSVAPSAASSLPPFEARQLAANQGKLDGELTALGAPWGDSLDNCVSDLDKGAPPLGGDESRHVTCRVGPAWVHFMIYKGAPQKDAARAYRQQLNFNSDVLAPGVKDPSRIAGGTSQVNGKLVEYAFKHTDGRIWCGMYWERDDAALSATLIETFCESDLGGDWEVLRDLWARHS